MEASQKLSKQSKNPPVDATMYRSIVGSLRYLVCSHPDVAYTAGIVSRFMESPTTEHMAAVKQILRYSEGTLELGVFTSTMKWGCNCMGSVTTIWQPGTLTIGKVPPASSCTSE